MKRRSIPLDEDFRSRFEPKSHLECWEWEGSITGYGYGSFWIGRHHVPARTHAHRFAYILNFGPVSDDLQVCHHCDNRKCVNPNHLFLGDHAANAQDRENKGRGNHPKGRPIIANRGLGNGNGILSDSQVLEIRRLLSTGGMTQRAIAKRFSVSPGTIFLINKGKLHAYLFSKVA